MRIKDLIEELRNLDPEREILCQVVAVDGKAWNMLFKIQDLPTAQNEWLSILTIYHPELKTLPELSEISNSNSD